MLKKLFGGKKDEFFIQLDETNAKPAEPAAVAPVSEAPVAKTEVTEVTEAPKTPAKAKKSSIKKSAKETAPAAPVAPVAAPAKIEPQQVEFATQYLLTQTLVRRQPGPSLDKFKAMARQVKTR